MNTPPAHIHLKPDAVPHTRHSPIPIPHHWKVIIKASLDRDVEREIIKPVPVSTPVTWCSPMVVVVKKDGTRRRTVDLQRLNSQYLRETHHCQSPFQLASQVPPNTKKTIIDAVEGYHAIKLDAASQLLTVLRNPTTSEDPNTDETVASILLNLIRNPCNDNEMDAAVLQEERIQAVGVHSLNDLSCIITLNDIQQKCSNDNIDDKLITTIRNGFPTKVQQTLNYANTGKHVIGYPALME